MQTINIRVNFYLVISRIYLIYKCSLKCKIKMTRIMIKANINICRMYCHINKEKQGIWMGFICTSKC